MRLIDRYLIREFAPYTALGFLLLTSVIFLHEASRFAELFIVFSRSGQPTGPLLSLVASVIPGIVVYTIPISLLLGILMGLGRLSSDSEITAMRASGIGRTRMLVPLLLAGVAASGAMLYLTFEVVPESQRALAALKESRGALAYHGISTQIKPRVFEESIPGQVLYIQDIDRHTGEWRNIFIADTTGEDANQPLVRTAQTGRMTSPDGPDLPELHLQRAQSHTTANIKERRKLDYNIDDAGSLAIIFEAPGTQKEAKADDEPPRVAEMSYANLVAYAPPDEQRVDYLVEINKRFALPSTCLVFALIGLAFGISNQRTGRSYGLLVGLVLTTLYYVLMLGGEQSARNGAVAPWVGVWGPNALFALLGAAAMAGRNFPILRALPSLVARRRPESDDEPAPERRATPAARASRRVAWPSFPRIIDRLIVSDLMRQFAFVTAGMTAVFLIFTLFELIGQIVANRVPATVVLGYVLYLTPQIVHYMAPLAVLVAVMVTFGVMAGGSQIVALKASGQSIYRMAVPVFATAAIFSAGLFLLQNYVLPVTNRQQEDLRQQIKSGQEPARTVFQPDRHWIFGRGSRIYYYRHYDPTSNTFAALNVFDLDPNTFQITRRIWAAQAHWDAASETWGLDYGWVRTFDGVRVLSADTFKQQNVRLDEGPDYFRQSERDADYLDFEGLRREIRELSQSGFDVLDLRIDLQRKVAFPLTCLVMALVGLPFAFSVGKRGALFGVAIGLGIGLVFWGALGLFDQMGRYEILPPVFAAWGPNVLFGATGTYLFLNSKT